MKSKVMKIGIVLSFILMSSSLFAATFQVPLDRTIVAVRVYDGWAAIEYTPSATNGLGCAGSVNNRVAIIDWRTKPELKTMYAAALGAFLLGKQVGFGLINPCSNLFGGGVPIIYRVDVK